jgi:hypothetical protein
LEFILVKAKELPPLIHISVEPDLIVVDASTAASA